MEGKNAQLQSGPSRSYWLSKDSITHTYTCTSWHTNGYIHINFSIPTSQSRMLVDWEGSLHFMRRDVAGGNANSNSNNNMPGYARLWVRIFGQDEMVVLSGGGRMCCVSCVYCVCISAACFVCNHCMCEPRTKVIFVERGRGYNKGLPVTEPFATKKATTQSSHQGRKSVRDEATDED